MVRIQCVSFSLFNLEGIRCGVKEKRKNIPHSTLRIPNSKYPYGGVAQLGERLPCKQEVRSSILLISTTVGMRRDTPN